MKKEEKDYTEPYKGIIMLRKVRVDDEEAWIGTVGSQIVSDGTYKTKKELIENLENINLERICKIIAGAFARAIELSIKEKEQ